MDFIRERKPEWWPEIQALIDQGYNTAQFAVEMFMFVQGRVDASRQWGELVDDFIDRKLQLTPNRADPCTYSGIFQGRPVIICRATDDFLVFCESPATYHAIITLFRERWTIHALEEVKLFFGIRFHMP